MSDAATMWRRFWFQFQLPTWKINALRVLFFGVLSLDAFLQLAHAPRYGAGGFNVSHVPFMDGLLFVPTRGAMVVVFLLQAYLAARIALGATSRWAVMLLAGLYGYAYFISQVDSYQHHYLVFLLLVISCAVPWQRARTTSDDRVASWGMRLFMVQLALLYFWAAIAKMGDRWVDGTALDKQMSVDWVRDVIEFLPGEYGSVAKSIVLAELALAAGIFWRKAWPVVWILGVGFHVSVELAGFQIGLFSYFMLGIYVIFLPDWLPVPRLELERPRRWLQRVGRDPIGSWLIAALAVGAGAGLLAPLPFEALAGVIVTTALIAAVSVGLAMRISGAERVRQSLIHLVACAALLLFHAGTDQAFDYYKFLAGTSRRLGDEPTMRMAYQRLIEIDSSWGPAYYHLGNAKRKEGDLEGALELFGKAQQRPPDDPRPYLGAAQIHNMQGDRAAMLEILEACQKDVPDEPDCHVALARVYRSRGQPDRALEAARKALELDPRNRTAAAIARWAETIGE